MRNYVQSGNIVTLAAPAGGVKSGGGVLVGALFGVAAYDADEGVEVETQLVGVFDMPKATGAVAAGAKLYWDSTAKNLTTTASGNKLVGAALLAAGSGEATVRVRLDGTTV